MVNPSPAPLLLLHGFPLDSRMWRFTIERFRPERLVMATDAGDLLAGTDTPSMRAMAGRAGRIVNEIAKKAPVVVVGLSMGGYVALEFCRAFPERVAGLVLCDTRATADTQESKANRDRMIEEVRAKGVLVGTEPLVGKLLHEPSPELAAEVQTIVREQSEEFIVACITALRDREDNTAVLEALDVPSLMVSGMEDVLAPPAIALEMAERARNGRAVLIPNAAHLPPLEQPEAFNAALAEFLGELQR